MSIKESNEITLKVTVTNEAFKNILLNNSFIEKEIFSLDDYYLIPKDLNLDNISAREILAKAVIVRNINDENGRRKKITFKIKNIDSNGEILSQEAINCDIYDKDEAIHLFEAIGYNLIMNIKEDDIVFEKDGFEIAVKSLKDNTLIEIETDDKYDTIEKLKKKVIELKLPVDTSDYFVKKAELELNKILGRHNK